MMSRRQDAWYPPQWLSITFAIAIGLVGIGSAVVWYEYVDEQGDARYRCEQTVRAREDTRAMWLRLFEKFPDDADELGLTYDLERLVPSLECNGGTWKPVDASD